METGPQAGKIGIALSPLLALVLLVVWRVRRKKTRQSSEQEMRRLLRPSDDYVSGQDIDDEFLQEDYEGMLEQSDEGPEDAEVFDVGEEQHDFAVDDVAGPNDVSDPSGVVDRRRGF